MIDAHSFLLRSIILRVAFFYIEDDNLLSQSLINLRSY